MATFTGNHTYRVRVHEEDGSYWAEVLDMPGCFASGESLDELRDALMEAMSMYLTSRNVTVNIHEIVLEPISDPDHEDEGCYQATVPAA